MRKHKLVIDEEGWIVPRASSKSRMIYLRMKEGVKPRHIADEIGMDRGVVRVLMHRIRNPDRRVRQA